MMDKRRCPVCRQLVQPSKGRCVTAHVDRTGRSLCPMTGESYDLAVFTHR